MTAEEFAKLVDRTGLKLRKIGELCGKKENTITGYCRGYKKVPVLVADKVKQLDRAINGLGVE